MVKALVWLLIGMYVVPWAWKMALAWGPDRGLN